MVLLPKSHLTNFSFEIAAGEITHGTDNNVPTSKLPLVYRILS
jgi:hypothetical protein